jgi:hypothetical protein
MKSFYQELESGLVFLPELGSDVIPFRHHARMTSSISRSISSWPTPKRAEL